MSSSLAIDSEAAMAMIRSAWAEPNTGILQQLKDYIAIPNQSPGFDPDVLTNGHQDRAVKLMVDWARAQSSSIKGLNVDVKQETGRTPVILLTIPATDESNDSTVLMYGHMDKQPPMLPWAEGLGPWTPVERDGKLYGRGGADDGYAMFASLSAVAVLQRQGVKHARIVVLIEACEESGSKDLPFYLGQLAAEIGTPSLVVCLDSGCSNYEQLWLTSSLRGSLVIDIGVRQLSEGVHSGASSGVVPSTFRIMRQLLDRIEDPVTGKLPDVCYAPIPETDKKFALSVAQTIGDVIVSKYPFLDGVGPFIKPDPAHKYSAEELANLMLKVTWEPTVSYTGMEGIPSFPAAGNVLRPYTGLKLSIRLPPTVDPQTVFAQLQKELTRDPPYGAHVTVRFDKGQPGWVAPPLAPWLHQSLLTASQAFYQRPFICQGEGGSIPFMFMLGERFPSTQFVITGVLGPGSNAHGPNEFLHIDMAQKLTACVANVLADQAKNVKQ